MDLVNVDYDVKSFLRGVQNSKDAVWFIGDVLRIYSQNGRHVKVGEEKRGRGSFAEGCLCTKPRLYHFTNTLGKKNARI